MPDDLRHQRRRAILLSLSGALGVLLAIAVAGLGGAGLLGAPQGGEPQLGSVALIALGTFSTIASLALFFIGLQVIWRLRPREEAVLVPPGEAGSSVVGAGGERDSDLGSTLEDPPDENRSASEPEPNSGVRVLRREASVTIQQVKTQTGGYFDSSVEALDQASLVGQILNETYSIEDQLGEGGVAAVYVARHLRTGRRYAIKTLLPGVRYSEQAIRRFEREAAAASALGHRGILAVHDFDVTQEGLHFMVTELLLGETLEARLNREGALTWESASRIVSEIGEALQAAHEAGILHRDIKPSNIYLAAEPEGVERVVLLDFGLVKHLDDRQVTKLTTSGTVVGTPLYMAPEQACSEHLDARCDVYSLGAVLYELLTGEPPFFANTIAGIYSRLLNELHLPVSGRVTGQLPADLDELIDRVLAKNPEERFQTARAFIVAIGEIRRKQWPLPVEPLDEAS